MWKQLNHEELQRRLWEKPPTLDEQIAGWKRVVEKQDGNMDGLSIIEYMRPYTRLCHLLCIKMEQLINENKK